MMSMGRAYQPADSGKLLVGGRVQQRITSLPPFHGGADFLHHTADQAGPGAGIGWEHHCFDQRIK